MVLTKNIKKTSKSKFSTEELKQKGFWMYRSGGWWTNGVIILDNKFGGLYKKDVLIKKINSLNEI